MANWKFLSLYPNSIGVLDSKTTLNVNDVIVINDSEDSNIIKSSKIDNLLNVNPYGLNYQIQKSLARSTTTSSTYQDKVTLTTGSLTGTYRVSWFCLLDNNVSISTVRLYNNTDSSAVGDVQYFKPSNKDVIAPHYGFDTVVFTGSSKVFKLQYRDNDGGKEVGIRDAKVEIWRVS